MLVVDKNADNIAGSMRQKSDEQARAADTSYDQPGHPE